MLSRPAFFAFTTTVDIAKVFVTDGEGIIAILATPPSVALNRILLWNLARNGGSIVRCCEDGGWL